MENLLQNIASVLWIVLGVCFFFGLRKWSKRFSELYDELKEEISIPVVQGHREKKIIIKRYGLYGEKEITQKKVADELNISRSYVSRIEKRALTKLLREFIRNNHR